MIVVDTNLLAYLLLGGAGTEVARAVHRRDPAWAAPVLWQSEFRNVLAGQMRRKELGIEDALALMRAASRVVARREHEVSSNRVLELAAASTCTAYDCEFVALADALNAPLVTFDRQILRDFPTLAVEPSRFVTHS